MTAVKFCLLVAVACALDPGTIGPFMPAAAAGSMRGDVNCNQATDAIDTALMLQLDAQLVDSLPCEQAGDVDHNAVTNSIDGAFVLQFVARLIPSLPALVHLSIDTAQPVQVGEEFVVDVTISDVDHLAGFDFALSFDSNVVTFERIEGLGAFLSGSSRSQVDCFQVPKGVSALCVTEGLPPCLGGPPGPSGEGSLARVVFRAREGGIARLRFLRSTLASDDPQPCNLDRGEVLAIPHQNAGADVQIASTPVP